MPSIEAAIEARAVAVAGLTALIGTVPTRLYPVDAEQRSNLPYVTYQVVSAARPHVMSADKESQARVQFDIWASSWVIARQVRDQMLVAFDRLTGTFASTTIDGSVCENDGSQVAPDEAAPDTRRLTMEFIMTWRLA